MGNDASTVPGALLVNRTNVSFVVSPQKFSAQAVPVKRNQAINTLHRLRVFMMSSSAYRRPRLSSSTRRLRWILHRRTARTC